MRNLSFVMFTIVITTILSLAGFYLYIKITSLSPWFQVHSLYVKVTIVLFLLLQVIGPLTYRQWPSGQASPFILQWMTYITLGFFSCLLFYFLFAEIITFILKPWLNHGFVTERRVFIGISVVSIANALLGIRNAMGYPILETVEIKSAQLPLDLQDLKIIQISDLHVGPTIKRDYVENVVAQTLAQKPDLIFLTGDMADGRVEFLKNEIEPIKNLTAPLGVFYVTGNHEYYWNGQEWVDYFKECGFSVLINEHKVIYKKSAAIAVAGVTDLKAGQFYKDHVCDPRKALANCPPEAYKILLAHQPDTFKILQDEGKPISLDLQVSGHTHGGQFLPWSLAVSLVQKYLKGLYKEGSTFIYVNRGTGYWGPPFRFPQKAEITLLQLKKEEGMTEKV